MNYTQAQIDRANAVSLEDFLRTQGETLIKSGREYRWKEHDSLTVRGNKWFRHSQSKGGYPIDFVMEFYGKSFPEAVQLLTGESAEGQSEASTAPPTAFHLPLHNRTADRAIQYLTESRGLNKTLVETFLLSGDIYEDAKRHNVVFVGRSVVQGQVERCGRCCGGFGLSLAVFACQHLNSFGKGLAVKLHDEINGIAALALAVAKPLVSPDGQAVMFFPTVFPSAFDKCLSLCAEKIFQTDGVCPVNLCLGVIHRDSSSFFCRVWGRFWSICSSVRSLNRAAVSTHDLTFQRRCKSSLTVLNSP